MQLPVLNLPLSAIGQLDLHVQLSLTHHQVQIHTSFHRFKEIGQVKKIQFKCSINTRKTLSKLQLKSGQDPVRMTWKPRRGLRSKNPK